MPADPDAKRGAGPLPGLKGPTFTIVIPAFNAAATLTSCAESVLAQTDRDLELVIIDDGSTDETARVARSLADPRVAIHSTPNAGLPAARNVGISRSRGSVVCFLDADDLLLPSYLHTVRATFAADPAVAFVYSDAWTFDDRTRRVRRNTTTHYQHPPRPVPATAQEMFSELLIRNFIIVPVAVKREAIVGVGAFDETLSSAEDWDIWLRLTAAGHRGAEAPGPLGLRREHPAQMSANALRMVDNRICLFEKLLAWSDLSDRDAARVSGQLARARRERLVVSGQDRPRALVRRARHAAGRLKRRVGLGARWYREPPPAVRAAFGDLSGV
ncbi:MAG: glycosyltransferase [Solirubrobacteraceae bacterium]